MAALIAGLVTGILSGFGVGGGTLLLIYMTAFAGLPQGQAQGINLLYFLPTALLALPTHVKNGFVEKQALLPASLTGLVGTAASAWIATGLETELLHRLFGGFLLYVGVSELFRRPSPAKDSTPPDGSCDRSDTPPK